jgi:hypothetical protein
LATLYLHHRCHGVGSSSKTSMEANWCNGSNSDAGGGGGGGGQKQGRD